MKVWDRRMLYKTGRTVPLRGPRRQQGKRVDDLIYYRTCREIACGNQRR